MADGEYWTCGMAPISDLVASKGGQNTDGLLGWEQDITVAGDHLQMGEWWTLTELEWLSTDKEKVKGQVKGKKSYHCR